MLHLQYYNSILKNNHISKILNNYKIKYSRIANEIESKINEMMKFFLKDILEFLENIEEVSDQRHKLIEYDKNKKELELTRLKLKNKTYTEHKLKNDFDLLQQENNLLKVKIDSLNKKISNLRNFTSNSQNESPIRKVFSNNSDRNKYRSIAKMNNTFMSPKIGKQNNLYIVLNNTSIMEENINNKNNKSTFSLDSPKKKNNKKNFVFTDKPKQSNKSVCINVNNQKKKINAKKFVNNKTIKFAKNNKKNNSNKNLRKSYDKKFENISPRSGPIINSLSNKNNKNVKINIKTNNSTELEFKHLNKYSPLHSYNQTLDIPPTNNNNMNYEDLGKKINEIFDSELKELEQDEANIELLLEQLIDENEY